MPVSNRGRLPCYCYLPAVPNPGMLPKLLVANTPAFPPTMIQGLSDLSQGGTGLRGAAPQLRLSLNFQPQSFFVFRNKLASRFIQLNYQHNQTLVTC